MLLKLILLVAKFWLLSCVYIHGIQSQELETLAYHTLRKYTFR